MPGRPELAGPPSVNTDNAASPTYKRTVLPPQRPSNCTAHMGEAQPCQALGTSDPEAVPRDPRRPLWVRGGDLKLVGCF